jgi:Ca2+-binding RTX toxin-like protein
MSVIIGSSEDDIITGSQDDDWINGGEGFDVIEGGDGEDTLEGGKDGDLIQGGAGNDFITGQGYKKHFKGEDNQPETIPVGPKDTVSGGTGPDRFLLPKRPDIPLNGRHPLTEKQLNKIREHVTDYNPNEDTLEWSGGELPPIGSQRLSSIESILSELNNPLFSPEPTSPENIESDASDKDTLYGGEGDDQIFGNQDDDLIFGDSGNDTIRGNQGNDTLSGGEGNDLVRGGQNDDSISGGDGSDTLLGGRVGNDTILGGSGDDLLRGFKGEDRLYGGIGNDTLRGGEGNDLLSGDTGFDQLVGGAGSDTFRIETIVPGELDTIADFTLGEDQIQLPLGDDSLISFFSGNPNQAANGATLIYDPKTGLLSYNPDGLASTGDEIDILKLDKKLDLDGNDFQSF